MLQIDVCPAIAHTLHTQIACCWRLSAACEWLWLLRPSLACSTYDAAFCYRQSSLVCRSVWMQRSRVHVRESCKTAEPIEMPFGDDSGGPKEPCMMYYMGSRCPTVGGNFWGLSGSFQSVVSLYCVHCSKKSITPSAARCIQASIMARYAMRPFAKTLWPHLLYFLHFCV